MTLLRPYSHGACLVLKLCSQRFDASLVGEFKRCLDVVASPLPKDLAIDMSEVKFVDSSALGALVSLVKQAQGSRLRMLGVTPPVMGLFKLTRMDRVFEIVDVLEPANA